MTKNNTDMKEYDDPFKLEPIYNIYCIELVFYFHPTSISGIRFKHCFLSIHGRPTTTYEIKSINTCIINAKEFNEDEI